MRSHLSHTPHIFTNMCLPHGKPYAIKSHFILDSSFLCCAWLCCHTHAHSSCSCFSSILPPPCGCIMSSISVMPALDCIGRFCHIPFISPSHLQPSSPTLCSQRHELQSILTQNATPDLWTSIMFLLFSLHFDLSTYIHTSSHFVHSSEPVPGCVHCSGL